MYRVSATVRSTHNQDGAIVLDVRQGQVFNLNFVGSRILELIKSGSAESDIVEKISREFDIGRDLAQKDVQEFLQPRLHCYIRSHNRCPRLPCPQAYKIQYRNPSRITHDRLDEPIGLAMRIKPARALSLLEICREAYQRQRL